jgi:hypothetical protein
MAGALLPRARSTEMTIQSGLWRKAVAMALLLALTLPATPVLARDWDDRRGHHGRHDGRHWDRGDHREHWRHRGGRHHDRDGWHGQRRQHHGHRHHRDFRPPVVLVPRPRHHFHHRPPVVVVRPHGHRHHGYGHHHGHDAYKWIAFTAITLGVLDFLSESQLRAHQQAQIYATTAPVGRPIVWREGGAYGEVVAVRDGESVDGRYCREYQQTVTVGNRQEQAYGTACLRPDGAWQMVRMSN